MLVYRKPRTVMILGKTQKVVSIPEEVSDNIPLHKGDKVQVAYDLQTQEIRLTKIKEEKS